MTKTKNPSKNPMGKPISTERARELNALRRTHGAGPGRPRSAALRCPCGAMTLRCALVRNHDCEEQEPKSHKRKEDL